MRTSSLKSGSTFFPYHFLGFNKHYLDSHVEKKYFIWSIKIKLSSTRLWSPILVSHSGMLDRWIETNSRISLSLPITVVTWREDRDQKVDSILIINCMHRNGTILIPNEILLLARSLQLYLKRKNQLSWVKYELSWKNNSMQHRMLL